MSSNKWKNEIDPADAAQELTSLSISRFNGWLKANGYNTFNFRSRKALKKSVAAEACTISKLGKTFSSFTEDDVLRLFHDFGVNKNLCTKEHAAAFIEDLKERNVATRLGVTHPNGDAYFFNDYGLDVVVEVRKQFDIDANGQIKLRPSELNRIMKGVTARTPSACGYHI